MKKARAMLKERISKNGRQETKPRDGGCGYRCVEGDIDRTLAMTRTSTASMGKLDRMLDGEKKRRGVRRKVSVPACLLPHAHSLLFAPVRPD